MANQTTTLLKAKLTSGFSRTFNWCRLLFAKPVHRKNVHRSRKVLAKLRSIAAEQNNNPEGALPAVVAYLRKIDPYLMEEVVLSAFEQLGHFVLRGRRYSGDGGVDGIVYHNGKSYLIQCKRYASHINPAHVRDFDQLLQKEGKKGFFVHCGKTGPESWAGGDRSRVKILSGQKLVRLLVP